MSHDDRGFEVLAVCRPRRRLSNQRLRRMRDRSREREGKHTHTTGRRLIWVTNVYIPDGDSLYRLESLIRTLRWLVNASLVSDP